MDRYQKAKVDVEKISKIKGLKFMSGMVGNETLAACVSSHFRQNVPREN
jgi:hypothetical protein